MSLTNDAFAWTGHGNGSTASVANGLNQLTSVGAAGLTYDARGNGENAPCTHMVLVFAITSDGATTFTYDSENRLISAAGAKNATLSYDPLGRLHQLTAPSGTTRFQYDGLELIAEYGPSGTMLRRHAYGPGVDEPVLSDEGTALNCTGTKVLHNDERGSIIGQADCWGNRAAVNSYDEYGKPGAANTGRFQYDYGRLR